MDSSSLYNARITQLDPKPFTSGHRPLNGASALPTLLTSPNRRKIFLILSRLLLLVLDLYGRATALLSRRKIGICLVWTLQWQEPAFTNSVANYSTITHLEQKQLLPKNNDENLMQLLRVEDGFLISFRGLCWHSPPFCALNIFNSVAKIVINK